MNWYFFKYKKIQSSGVPLWFLWNKKLFCCIVRNIIETYLAAFEKFVISTEGDKIEFGNFFTIFFLLHKQLLTPRSLDAHKMLLNSSIRIA